jgi:hypothetical protein
VKRQLILPPGEMSEGPVGLSHAVHVLARSYGSTLFIESGTEFISQGHSHWLSFGGSGGLDDPTKSQSLLSLGTNLHGHLVVGSSDTARSHLNGGLNIANGCLKDLKWGDILDPLGNDFQGIIKEPLGDRLLSAPHDAVDKFSGQLRAVTRVRL